MEYSSEDLKTISHLAPFQRNRVAYNPKNIDYYLRTLGNIPYNESAIDILCFEGGQCGNENKNIPYEEWILLSWILYWFIGYNGIQKGLLWVLSVIILCPILLK